MTKFSIGCLNYHYLTIRNSIELKTSRELLLLVKTWIIRLTYAFYLDWMIPESAIELRIQSFLLKQTDLPKLTQLIFFQISLV